MIVDLDRFPLSSIRKTVEIRKATRRQGRFTDEHVSRGQLCLCPLADLVCFTGWLETEGKQRKPTAPKTSQGTFRIYEKHPGSSTNETLGSACTDNTHFNEVVHVRHIPNQR